MPRKRSQQDGQQVNGEENSSEGSESGSDSENDDASQPQSRSPSPAPFDLSSTAPDAPTPLITRLSISADGQWLASADTHRRLHIFNLDSVAHHAALPSTPQMINAMTFWSVKPPSASANVDSAGVMDVDMPASHASSPLLVLALANNTLSMYDVEGRRFPEWAQRICEAIPPTFKRLYDPVQGIMVDPGMGEKARKSSDEDENDADAMNVDGEDRSEGGSEDDSNTRKKPTQKPKPFQTSASNRIFFWGSSWLCSADLSPKSTSSTLTASNFYDPPPGLPGAVSKKRRFEIAKIQEHRTLQSMKNRDAQNNFGATFNLYALDNNSTRETNRIQSATPRPSFNIITRYRPMLFADFLGPNELVVVERPLVDLMSALPPAFFKSKYGT
jgi:U3 small nucleolar RNA-associated protein 4